MKLLSNFPSFVRRYVSIVVYMLSPFLFFFAQSGASGQTQTLEATRPLGHTPVHVLDGRAKLLQHYEPNKMLRITIGLRPPHLEEERALIDQLHDKKSPEFHKWLTPEEWDDRFAPSVEDEQAVVDWANSQGLNVTNRFADRLLVDVVAPAGVIERAFNVRINNYAMEDETFFSNDKDPEVPSSVAPVIQSVMGLNSFLQLRPGVAGVRKPAPRPDFVPGPPKVEESGAHADGNHDKFESAMQKPSKGAKAVTSAHTTNGFYDPTDIYSSEAYDTQALYNQGHCCNPYHGAGSPPETSIAIAAFGDLAYSDVNSFQSQFSYLAENVQKVYIDGNYACTNSPKLNYDLNCLEVTLDTEWAMAMSNSFGSYVDTSKVWVYEGASYSNLADVYNFMVSDGHAKVTSTSWSCSEFACADGPTMDSLDAIFSKMVGQGWTLIAASGDRGATDDCTASDKVGFPDSDPNFIAAGGTTLSLFNGPVYNSETGWTGGTGTGSCSKNNGGSGGGFSKHFASPSYQASFRYANRSLPDVALNANSGQNIYFQPTGGLTGIGGTSIVAPELAGFFAQQNAYGLAIGNVCGGGNSACAPIGNANYYIYQAGARTGPHDPFYDITSGCNSNDITAANRLGYFCAGTGFDQVTGWGSFNMLQLAWDINWYTAQANGGPTVSFNGPAKYVWHNTDQTVSWNIVDNVGDRGGQPTGIAGFTQGWDSLPSDVYGEATPGSANSFYSGPQFPNGTGGCLQTGTDNGCSGNTSQGCHTAYVQGWNNMGVSTGIQAYGPVCWDNVLPITKIALSGTLVSGIYTSPVTISISATDATSGVQGIYYTIDGSPLTGYQAPITVGQGYHYLSTYSMDNAGNKSYVQASLFSVQSPTATTLAASATALTYGNSLTLTAVVKPTFGVAPTGTMTFSDGAVTLGTATVTGGKATLVVSTGLIAGVNHISAVYGGSSGDKGSATNIVTVTVNKANTSTAIVSSANPVHYGNAVTFTALVKPATTGIPSGSITFKNGTTTLATVALTGGQAVYTATSLSLGAHPITAVYAGSSVFNPSSSAAITETVQTEPTSTLITSLNNPSTFGSKVTLIATVNASAGTPSGTVTLKSGTKTIVAASLSSGRAVFNLVSTTVGTVPYTAVYSGSTDFAASTSPGFNQVETKEPTTTTLATALNPAVFGQLVTFTATVKSANPGIPTGTVTFKNGTVALGTVALVSGKATFMSNTLPAGSLVITVSYGGDANYSSNVSGAITEVVNRGSTTTALVTSLNPSLYQQAINLTAVVKSATSVPTGSVSFTSGGAVLGTVTLSGGQAKLSISSLAVGSHSITANYSGSSNNNGGSSTAVVEVVKPVPTSTTLVSSVNPGKKGAAVQFTASVSASGLTPIGIVNFMDGGNKIATVNLSSGKAVYTSFALAAGTHSITAEYLGNSVIAPSNSATITETINP